MDVFLTGATGYIGGAIADALLRAGHGVLGLARSDKVAEVMRARSISPLRGDRESYQGSAASRRCHSGRYDEQQ